MKRKTWSLFQSIHGLEGVTGDGKREHHILGISEIKWTGMGEFDSGDHYTYYCGKDPLEEME